MELVSNAFLYKITCVIQSKGDSEKERKMARGTKMLDNNYENSSLKINCILWFLVLLWFIILAAAQYHTGSMGNPARK